MDQLIIKNQAGGQLALIGYGVARTVEKAEQNKKLLGEDTVSIAVNSAGPLLFKIGDYIEAFGEIYVLNAQPIATKKGENRFYYELNFEGAQYSLQRSQYYSTDVSAFNTGVEFSLTGDLTMFIGVLMNNIARTLPNWSLGTVIPTSEKTLSFNNEDCLAVLQRLCAEFATEFRIDYNGNNRILQVGKQGTILPYTFEYGNAKGVKEFKRQTVSQSGFLTRLYALGSSKNIPTSYRGNSSRLLFANIPANYVENAVNVAAFGIIEGTKIFDDIYPHRTGTVTGLGSNLITFVDAGMDFDLNAQLLAGTTAKVHFNTGKLAGYEFEVKTYTHATKTFVLSPFTDNGQEYPKAGAFAIATGDKYVLLDILMPQSYVDAAELQLKNEAQAFLDTNGKPRAQYTITLDELYLGNRTNPGVVANWFSLGDTITVLDSDLQISGGTRVIGFKRDLINHYRYTIDVGDTYDVSIITRQLADQRNVSRIIKINQLRDARAAKYGYQISQELLKDVFDTDGYFDTTKIKSLSIETAMLSVGSRSQQFQLRIVIEPNYGGQPNVVKVGVGTLTHLTIEDTIKTWQIAPGLVTITDNNSRYIYAKLPKGDYNNGSIVFDTAQRKFDSDSSYWYILIGELHSVSTELNIRRISLTYGFTTINGRFITTGRITSADGLTYFDLDAGEIGGKIIFKRNDGSTGDIDDISQDLANFSATIQQFQTQIDGVIETYYTNTNPAIWSTGERPAHVGDMWYKLDSKELFFYSSSFVWTRIEDKDVVAAYEAASKAQDTADGKRRVFTQQPYAPYDLGDLWMQGAGGDILYCVTGKTPGQPYAQIDWVLSSKYTDNSALTNFVNVTFANSLSALHTQLDGKIDTWYSNTDPQAAWSTSAEKDTHDGDLWYKIDTNQLFWYDLNHNWNPVNNADAIAAYQAASHAVDTADGKRRIFTTQPYAPYDVGDMWSQGPTGDLLVCINAKAAGQPYFIQDWVLSSKYTDNSALNAFVNGTYNIFASAIVGQVDKKAENWFSSTDPATWSVQEKIQHVGDMWYKFTTRELFYYDGNYNWSIIQDKDAIAAFEKASQLESAADGKITHFSATPYAPYGVGDLWTNGQVLQRCITTKVAGQSFSQLDWVLAVSYDSTVTAINGGIVVTGTIKLAGNDGSIKAGITGGGTDTSVRIWAGTSYENRELAPFRVLQGGEAFVSKRLEILNEDQIGQAGFSGSTASGQSLVRMWAGKTWGERDLAPFRVYGDGSIYASQGQIGRLLIHDGFLENTDAQGEYGIVLQSAGRFAAIGKNTFSAAVGASSVARFENTGSSYAGANIAVYALASGNAGGNYAIFAPAGASMLGDALINGMRSHYGVGTSFNDDPSLFNQIAINPNGSSNVSTVNFTTPSITVGLGKFMFISNTGTAGVVRLNGIVRGASTYDLPTGQTILIINTGAGWHVASSYRNSY